MRAPEIQNYIGKRINLSTFFFREIIDYLVTYTIFYFDTKSAECGERFVAKGIFRALTN